ncbi:hypothetical protein GCK32_000290 [Trichostrongylus colubriformis]|uniref:Uncharacterized protein n=1 Tax=Trichostrongylus colubriformis TaxID=6319 RepID=A0AAN8ID29_TRICO
MVDIPPHSGIAPHRGFNHKAREVLIGGSDIHLNAMAKKSSSEFDLRRKLVVGLNSRSPPATPRSPRTPHSTCSSHDEPIFDAIGERPMVKRHKQLAQIGKTKSCGEIKHMERRLIRTYQEENIVKMPSIDSELTNLDLSSDRSLVEVEKIAKSHTYEVTEDQKKKNVTLWLDKHS